MIDEKDLIEALERQKEQIAERILWEKVDLPFYDYVCEDVVRYTGLSQEKVEEIAEKCRWKVTYINRCGAALLMESVKKLSGFFGKCR